MPACIAGALAAGWLGGGCAADIAAGIVVDVLVFQPVHFVLSWRADASLPVIVMVFAKTVSSTVAHGVLCAARAGKADAANNAMLNAIFLIFCSLNGFVCEIPVIFKFSMFKA